MSYLKHYLMYAFAAFALALAPHVNAIPVDLELSLVADVSPSVDNAEFAVQMEGYRSAFEDASVQAAIAALPGGIAVNVIFFSESAVGKVGWVHITDAATASEFAGVFPTLGRVPPINNGTDIAEGYELAIGSFEDNGFEGKRRVIDISGDGPQNLNDGCPGTGNGTDQACVDQTNDARAAAEAANIVVNGVVVGPTAPVFLPADGLSYYEEFVITSNGFAVAATDFDDFVPVVRNKIFREITLQVDDEKVMEPNAITLLVIGIVSLAFFARRRRSESVR